MIFSNLFGNKSEDKSKSERIPSFCVVFNEKLGNYLADKYGQSLYFSEKLNFKKNKYKSNIINEPENNRMGIWQIFHEENIITLSAFKKKDFSNIKRSDGLMQTAYKGYPLFYYKNDLNPGDIKGEGINGEWFVVKIKSNF